MITSRKFQIILWSENNKSPTRLKDLLHQRLLECGWRSNIEKMIRQTIQERGVANLTHDELAAEIVPHVGDKG